MYVCLYSNIFHFLNFIFGQKEIHNKKLSFQKITEKIDRNLKWKKPTLSCSNIFFIFLNFINEQIEIHNKKLSFQKITEKFIQRQKCSNTEILKKLNKWLQWQKMEI